jgi:hypothetical protein
MRTSSSPAPAPTPSWTGCRGKLPGFSSVIPGPDRESPHPGFIRSRNRAGFQDRILVLAGNGKFDVIDVEEVPIDPGDRLLVDKVGPMDAEEMGLQDGFPLGDGSLVPEEAAAGRNDGGDVIVGFDVEDSLNGEAAASGSHSSPASGSTSSPRARRPRCSRLLTRRAISGSRRAS